MRTEWEVALGLCLQNATWYLGLLELDRQQSVVYAKMFNAKDIKLWARTRAIQQIEFANQIAELHPEGCDVPSVETHYNDALHAMGLCGTIRAVGLNKTDE